MPPSISHHCCFCSNSPLPLSSTFPQKSDVFSAPIFISEGGGILPMLFIVATTPWIPPSIKLPIAILRWVLVVLLHSSQVHALMGLQGWWWEHHFCCTLPFNGGPFWQKTLLCILGLAVPEVNAEVDGTGKDNGTGCEKLTVLGSSSFLWSFIITYKIGQDRKQGQHPYLLSAAVFQCLHSDIQN